ncbi:MAG TPA: DNA repair protein RadA [Candidatus Limnocylindrales bacterium]|nr:DNA repair protein RadA [Candidatus Limnocylindrales bacterium]
MARQQSRYVCQACGDAFLKWEGQCRSCGGWNTLVETLVRERAGRRPASVAGPSAEPEPLGLAADPELPRIAIGMPELDRVLGGGLVPGSLVLIGGEPGVGKSTLLLQAAGALAGAATGTALVGGPTSVASRGPSVLYVTGEESAGQVRLRARRLGLLDGRAAEQVHVVAETDLGRIVELARRARPSILIVDSIQTISVAELDGVAGSVGQVRECALRLMELAKGEGIATLLVGHVTKDGSLAGPKTLEHLVDAVLAFEGERFAALRLIRASKNRFGPTDEVGVFEMRDAGLVEVREPGRAFLVDRDVAAPGSVVAPTLEGSRPILVEVQALVAPAGFGTPRRTASGLDPNRLALLIAVLGRRAGIGLASHDVYANVAGGIAVAEPAIDLPLALALASSLHDRPVATGSVAFGEVGLLGELRTVSGLERRVREAGRLGFDRAIVPRSAAGHGLGSTVGGVRLDFVGTLRDAVALALEATDDVSGRQRAVLA